MFGRPIHAAVIAHVLLAIAVQIDNGYYTPTALALAIAAFAVLVRGARGARSAVSASTWAPSRGFLAVGILLLAVAGLIRRPLVHAVGHWFTPAAKGLDVGFITFALVRPFANPQPERMRRRFYWLLIAGALVLRVLVVIASPHPRIDVYVMSHESAIHLLRGQNPYTTEVSDPYQGRNVRLRHPRLHVPARDALPAVNRARPGRRPICLRAGGSGRRVRALVAPAGHDIPQPRRLVPLLFLAHPRGFFVIEQAWTEPLILLV